MGVEIERKFLVKNELWREHVVAESKLVQGYLARGDNATVRVRTNGGSAHINIKGATAGIRRTEFEYEIPLVDAEELLQQLALQPNIEKTRFRVRCGDHIWDLDLFAGENSGLVLAEIELESEQEQFEMPPWAGDEVSDDSRYYNANLAQLPFNRW
jgi:adenylate cyclase